MAGRVHVLVRADEQAGNLFSAARKLLRAPDVLPHRRAPGSSRRSAQAHALPPDSDHAEKLLAAAVKSPRRELRVFKLAEGGAEHCQADNGTFAVDYMADWIARTLGGRTR